MKPIGKKIITGTIAASFLIGGVALVHNQANAAAADSSSTQTNGDHASGFGKGGKHKGADFRGNKFIQQTATLLGTDEKTILDELKQGKSLAQIAQEKAGWTEEVYLQKLVDAENQAIDAAVSAGKLTQAQADKQKSGLSDRLKKAIENTKQLGQGHGQGQGFKGKGHFAAWGNPDSLAQILGITKQELMSSMQSGKSLVEIAQEKGISEDQLISKLKDNMTDQIKNFVEKKGKVHSKTAPDSAAPSSGATTPAQ